MEALVASKNGDIDIVDVRDAREFASGHVPGARHLPLDELRANPKDGLPRDNVIFVCAKGVRSATAAKIAEESAGKKDVYSLEGGTLAWATAGLPIVVPEQSKKAPAVEQPDASGAACGIDEPGLENIVGGNLRELRASRGLSLDEISKMAGISRTTLGQIELGKNAPSIGLVWKLAQALGVPFSTLLRTGGPAGTSVLRRATGKRLLSADGRFSWGALFPLFLL
jgi:rhodanese-related sulfurtransferase/transcriptional regulator with XRE-family HTH domain